MSSSIGNHNSTDAVGTCESIGYEGGVSLVDVDWEVLVNGDEYIESSESVAGDRRLPDRSASANRANRMGVNCSGDVASPWVAPAAFDSADEDTVSFLGPMDPLLPIPPPSISVTTLRTAQDEVSRDQDEVSTELTTGPEGVPRNRVRSLASGLVTVSEIDGAAATSGSATRVRSARSASAGPSGNARDAARAVLSAAGIEPVLRVKAVPIAEIRERGQRSPVSAAVEPTPDRSNAAGGNDASCIGSLPQTPIAEGSVAPHPEVHRDAAVEEAGYQPADQNQVGASTGNTRPGSSRRNTLLLLCLFLVPVAIALLILALVRTGQVDVGRLPFTGGDASAASMIDSGTA